MTKSEEVLKKLRGKIEGMPVSATNLIHRTSVLDTIDEAITEVKYGLLPDSIDDQFRRLEKRVTALECAFNQHTVDNLRNRTIGQTLSLEQKLEKTIEALDEIRAWGEAHLGVNPSPRYAINTVYKVFDTLGIKE